MAAPSVSTAHATSGELFGALDAPELNLSNVRSNRNVQPDPRLRNDTANTTSRHVVSDEHDSSPAVSLLAAAPATSFINRSRSAPLSSTTSPRPRATGHRDEHDAHTGINGTILDGIKGDSHVMLSEIHVASGHEQANIIDRIVDQSEPHTVPNVHSDQDDEAATTTLLLDGINGTIFDGINGTVFDGINGTIPDGINCTILDGINDAPLPIF